jgi:hypothetical protein
VRSAWKKYAIGLSGAAVVAAFAVTSLGASAAPGGQVVVTPSNTQGWSTADTRPGGAVNFVADATAPGSPNLGALQLTTDATTAAKAQYLHATDTPLTSVNELSYSTKQNSGPPEAAASYQLAVDLNGAAPGGFTTLVYEPYWNGVVSPTVWQSWDVTSGLLWSSSSFSDDTCTVTGTPGGPPTYTLAQVQSMCPDAVVQAFGVNVGTFNPLYNVEADLVGFNGTTYNFEPYQVAPDKDACKNGGWQTYTAANGQGFKNQGDCVSYFATGGKNKPNGSF